MLNKDFFDACKWAYRNKIISKKEYDTNKQSFLGVYNETAKNIAKKYKIKPKLISERQLERGDIIGKYNTKLALQIIQKGLWI